jgi:hypothetical protein
MAVTAHDVKAGWTWTSLYVVAAIVIGFFAGIIKLIAFLDDRRSASTDTES